MVELFSNLLLLTLHLTRGFFLHSLISKSHQISITWHKFDSFLLIGKILIVLDFAFNLVTQCQRECLSLLSGAQGEVRGLE